MKRALPLLLFATALLWTYNTRSQVKIGYASLEEVLARMPEKAQYDKNLEAFQSKLAATYRAREESGNKKLEELRSLLEKSAGQAQQKEAEWQNLLKQYERELSTLNADFESQMSKKQQELMTPVLDKLQNAINAVAKSQGFTLILNQTTGTGVPPILYGPPENDITLALYKQLGIPIPNNR